MLLKPIYIDDERFRKDFSEKTIKTTDSRSTRLVRFIICEIEKFVSNNHGIDFSSDAFNIEHIVPQNAPDNWCGFSYEEMNILTYHLGNMTLLQANANRDLGTAEYPQKREVLKLSSFEITHKLAEQYSEWAPESIASKYGLKIKLKRFGELFS